MHNVNFQTKQTTAEHLHCTR